MTPTAFRNDQRLLLGAGGLAVLALVMPVLSLVMLPVLYLNTHIHELCHALAAVATGGRVLEIAVLANGNGVTPIMGGNLVLVASSGYIGATLVGALMILYGRTERGARTVLWTLAAALGLSLALWVRSDWVGVMSGIGWALLCAFAAARFQGTGLRFTAQFLGMVQCLASIRAFNDLFAISLRAEMHSDAKIMEHATRLPSVIWASLWFVISVVAMGFALRAAWRGGPRWAER